MLHLIVLRSRSQVNFLLKMVSTRKKKSQNKWQRNRLDETFSDFVIGNGITVNALGNQILEPQG